jgi:hypothetical protein
MICKHCEHERQRHVVVRSDEDSQLTDELLQDFEERLETGAERRDSMSYRP